MQNSPFLKDNGVRLSVLLSCGTGTGVCTALMFSLCGMPIFPTDQTLSAELCLSEISEVYFPKSLKNPHVVCSLSELYVMSYTCLPC